MRLLLVACVVAFACDSTPPTPTPPTIADFDLTADLSRQDSFFSMPYPSDLRLTTEGTPDLRGFPNNLQESIITGLEAVAMGRVGFPQMPVAYFHFSAPIAAQDPTVVISGTNAPILLIDVDPKSPERGRTFPVVAGTPAADRYLLDGTLEIAPRVGIVLHEARTYAFVVMKSLKDAAGAELGAPDAFATLASTTAPELATWNVYQPLWPTLAQIGIDAKNVAIATVFTTGDVVQATADTTSKLAAQYTAPISNLSVASDQGTFCEIVGQITFPQFQAGVPPFDTDGLFSFASDGLPTKQGDLTVPIAISLPEGQAMPSGGYPFVLYLHGSGGLSTQLFDAEQDLNMTGKGPAFVMAPHGFAMAGAALPLNPERLPGASDYEYINFNNPACFPFTFAQGLVEQRLFVASLASLTLTPSMVASCTGLSLPNGETAYHFNMTPLHVQGQSMGGMYTNLLGATDSDVKVVVPTGAGGYWSYMVLTTQAIPNAQNGLKLLLGSGDLTFMHPALHLLETAWEAAEPFVYMPRIATRPLQGHPVRPIYEPVGHLDTNFSFDVYDGAALAYGNKEAGDVVWPSMQTTLALEGNGGIVPYPVSMDVTSSDGATKYTGAVVQYEGDGTTDPHYIALTNDSVKYQYACFHESFQKTGIATVYAPQSLGSPCP